MTSSGMKIPAILLICFSFLSLEGSAGTGEKRLIHVNENPDYTSPLLTREDGSFVFTTCKNVPDVGVLECVMHVVGLSGPEITYPFNYRTNEDHELPFNLTDHKLPFIHSRLDIFENVVYVLLEKLSPLDLFNVTILAIDLTSGAVSQLDLPPVSPYPPSDVSLIIDRNGANVIFEDSSVCGDHMLQCKFTFNKRGERLAGPVSFPIESGYLTSFPRVARSADEGLLVYQRVFTREFDFEFRSIYIDASGNTTILHRSPYRPVMFSDIGDLYLACSFIDYDVYKIDCAQYDWKLNETIAFKFSLSDSFDDGYRIISVASLAKSKILILHSDRRGKPRAGIEEARVSSINSNGQVLKTTQLFDDLDDPESTLINEAAIVEVDNQFCFYIVLRAKSDDPYLDSVHIGVYTKCIPKSDL